MTDDELRAALQQWEAPRAPASLRGRVLGKRTARWRTWALAAAGLLFFTLWWMWRPRPAVATHTLSDFEQVSEFQPRIVRNVP